MLFFNLQRNSTSPGDKYRPRSRTPDTHDSSTKRLKEEKNHDSDGEKSDLDLVVDVNEVGTVRAKVIL